jgi:predicted component of type VI protein secretion system
VEVVQPGALGDSRAFTDRFAKPILRGLIETAPPVRGPPCAQQQAVQDLDTRLTQLSRRPCGALPPRCRRACRTTSAT